jgi:hypothetical protein
MGHVLYVEVSRVPGDPLRLGDAVDYLASEVRPARERQHLNRPSATPAALNSGTTALITP